MVGYKVADWAEDPLYIENAAGNSLFKGVELNWSKPTDWKKGESRPTFQTDKAFVYALIRSHGNFQKKSNITYIGLTKAPKTRFGNHETAREIVEKNGTVQFSYADVNFTEGRNNIAKIENALEEIEHLLIWALVEHDLTNQKKQFTLPGMGQNGGHAWKITNIGHRFNGRMPQEIVFPWMLLKAGRNRSTNL